MKALVTGANGFLASNVVRELNRRGIPVRAMVRSTADLSALSGAEYELFYGNITSMADVMEAVKSCDVVIHAAADTSQHYLCIEPYLQVNVTGTLNMLKASCRNQVKKFIFVSTANTFGYGTKSNPGNENLPAKYPFTSSGYAISKTKAQELVIEYAKSGKLDTVVVNPTFMLGPFDAKPSSGRIITMMHTKKIVPVPPGGKNFVHVADVAGGICNAIERGRSGSCYLLANENLSYGEFYAKLANATGRSFYQIKLGPRFLHALGTIGTLAVKSGFRFNLNLVNAKILCVGNYYSSAKAVDELGLPQTPVDKAIADALEWFTQSGYLKN
ncbi:MAG: NAD-dependent epimerase/dehydratase family protein [Bacteroidales bacterium]|nr:NAD-dependent epimerase/dehydratase family protein [Bacteroidales bacterium]